jgi:hypothetical protein
LAYPAGTNNWHLNSPLQMQANADLVCKVHVVAVQDLGLVPCQQSLGAPPVMRKQATAKVVSVVTGQCSDTIRFEFDVPLPADRFQWGIGQFTELRPGEDCLVFLKNGETGYCLHYNRGKARVVPDPVAYDLGDEGVLRLLAEFLAGLSADDRQIRLQAAEELGYVGDALMKQLGPFPGGDDPDRSRRIAHGLRVGRDAIRKARGDNDLVVRSVAVVSSFGLGDPPGLDQAMELMQADPNRFTASQSTAEFGVRGFSVPALQRRLLETMDATTRRATRRIEDGTKIERAGIRPDLYRGVPGFPYAEFCRMVLRTDPVRHSAEMREAVANVLWIRYERASVPEMIKLLDDPGLHIRQTAVAALDQCVNGNFSNAWDRRTFYGLERTSGTSESVTEKPLEQRLADYERNEHEYIRYWKHWWQLNRDTFGEDNGLAAVLPASGRD